MLRSTYELEVPFKKGQYRLDLPIDDHWDRADKRVLLVLETVDGQDLREGQLLADRSRLVVTNLLSYCLKQVKKHGHPRGHAFAAVNFNNIKFLDQSKDLWSAYRGKFAKRILATIEQLDPTHVIIFGDAAAATLLPDIENLEKKRGWVHNVKLGGKRRLVTTSLDLENLYSNKKKPGQDAGDEDEDDDEGDRDTLGKANLLFYVSRNVTNNLCGRNLFDLSHIKANYRYVNTIEKFDKLFDKLMEAKYVGVDTETANLSSTCNAIGTIQFAMSTKKGYVVPIDHEQTPYTEEERAYIKKKLRKFFFAKPGTIPLKYLITQYGMFDLRVLREELNMPVIFHPVWEITAGEWCLDENLKYLKDFGTPHGGLEQIFCYYGNDHYMSSQFKKKDRSNTALTRLDNEGFLEYGSMDVQSIVGIHKMQKVRASFLELGDGTFEEAYHNLVTKQMSNTVHSVSHFEQRGNYIDRMYLAKLKGKESPLVALMNKYRTELNAMPEVKKANKIVVKESGTGARSKGIFDKIPWALNWNKGAHKIIVFFTVMGLKPISYTKEKLPQVDKRFIKHYAADHPLVEKYGQLSKLVKLYGTYVKGWWEKMRAHPDSSKDSRLRPRYGFFDVVTGRLNSFDPSLQQVPTRAEEAKYIKRSFVAPFGCLHIKFDYSAHEVRVWSYSGRDKLLAGVFKIGQRLRQLYRVRPSDWLKARIKKEGDIHIINVKFFFGLDVDKEHPLRDAIKQVVFGVIYGKGASTLAKDIKREVEFAKELIEKLFTKFRKAGQWLNWAVKHSEDHYYVYSILGMRRNLFAMMTGIKSLMSAMARRAKNSPIQGTASQIGLTTARLIVLEFYKVLSDLDLLDKKAKYMPSEPLKAVHDALYSETPYKLVLIYLHVVQHVATYGVTEYYEREFGVKFTVEPEVEMELGAHEAKAYKWDWSHGHLETCIKSALNDQKEIGFLKGSVDEAYKEIMWAYEDKKVRRYLETNYPILGVTREMEAEIIEEVEAMEIEVKKAAKLAAKSKDKEKATA